MPEEKEAGIFVILALIAAGGLFGISGIRTLLAIILMALPFYFILRFFSFGSGERLGYSLAVGIMVVPSLSYWIGFLIPFSLAILISVMGCLTIALAIGLFLKRKINKEKVKMQQEKGEEIKEQSMH